MCDACCSMSVRVNANLRSETVEQLLEKKKSILSDFLLGFFEN